MMERRWRTRLAAALIGIAGQASVALAQDFDYDPLINDPTPERVGAIIDQVARQGRGKHHFLLSYCTAAPGVVLPPHIRLRHPVEITIVLQWQYSDLRRIDDKIHVTVSFDSVPERIVIPLNALTYFSDPTVDLVIPLRAGEKKEERCSAEASV